MASMFHVCIMGGYEGVIEPESKFYLTLFAGAEFKRPTVARQILARRQQQREGRLHPPRQFFLTICGGVEITAPTLAEEFWTCGSSFTAASLPWTTGTGR
jgi:hypothetical protein